jgi:hypothetical protein
MEKVLKVRNIVLDQTLRFIRYIRADSGLVSVRTTARGTLRRTAAKDAK